MEDILKTAFSYWYLHLRKFRWKYRDIFIMYVPWTRPPTMNKNLQKGEKVKRQHGINCATSIGTRNLTAKDK